MIRKLIAGIFACALIGGAQAAADAPSGWVKCAQPGGTCTMSGTHQTTLGKSGVFAPYVVRTGNFACSTANFPGAPNPSAWCSYNPATASASSSSAASSVASSSSSSRSSSSVASSAASSTTSTGSSGQVGYSTQNGGTTGGAGGATVTVSTGTQLNAALCGRASVSTPIIIRVNGTINHGNTTQVSGSCSTAADVIELKGISNVTILGVGTSAIFDQIGIHIREASNIIIQNVHVRNVKKSGSPTSNGGDAIGMESNVHNVWVDHCTLEASGGEAEGYDGLFDMKANTKYVTLSWTILKNSERGGLVGSGDSDSGNGPVTYHHNYYQNLHSRLPLLRFATAHAFNNYYNGIIESGMNPRIGGKIKAQNNYFTNALNPIGTFYTDDMGYWDVSGNIFAANVTWSTPGADMHPAGPNVVSTTSISIPYAYSMDAATNVPNIVLNGAGVGHM